MPGLQISCTIPMCLAMRRSHPTREDLWCFLILFEVHIGHAHWTSFNFKAPNAVVNVRLYSLVLVSMLNCFANRPLGAKFLQVNSWEAASVKEKPDAILAYFGPCPHPIKFDFTRIYVETMVYIHLANSWDHDVMCPSIILIKQHVFEFSPRWKSFTWPGFLSVINRVLNHQESHWRSLIQNLNKISQLLSNCPALACANNVFAPASARLRLETGNSQCCAWALPRLWRTNAASLPCRSFGMASNSGKNSTN